MEPPVATSSAFAGTSSNATAAGHVFGNAKLFERVFIQLCDLRDVITCERVCREWKALIGALTLLEHHLFLDADTQIIAEDNTSGGVVPGWKLNPVLERFLDGESGAFLGMPSS